MAAAAKRKKPTKRRPAKAPSRPGVKAALERELAEIKRTNPKLAESAIAELALTLATELDNPDRSASRSKALCAKTLLETLEKLSRLAASEETGDRLDELSARRAGRVAGRATT